MRPGIFPNLRFSLRFISLDYTLISSDKINYSEVTHSLSFRLETYIIMNALRENSLNNFGLFFGYLNYNAFVLGISS